MRRLNRFECIIDFDEKELGVKSIIKSGREVVYYELFDDEGEDITINYYREDDHEAIKRLILEEWSIEQTADRVLDEVFSPTLAEVNARRGY